jgi:N-acetylmuramoyl-L-alanine amidase
MKIIENPSANFSQRKSNSAINSIVLHYTGMNSFEEALLRMQNPKNEVSCHFLIDLNGEIHQLVSEFDKAWHAGLSSWRGMENLNDFSIGIEIVNKGHEFGYEKFPEIQIESVVKLCKKLLSEHSKIDQRNIVGHSDIAPNRKEDPGELFPWKILSQQGIGIFHEINYESNFHYRQPAIIGNEEGKSIGEIQRKLSSLGYKIQRSTIFDEQTKKVVAAFYRRFIPERISLSQNHRFPENIVWDSLSDFILNDLLEKYSY